MRADVPADVAAFTQVLDLDDFGAKIGQIDRSGGPGAILFDRQHPYAGQRQVAVSGHGAPVTRCIAARAAVVNALANARSMQSLRLKLWQAALYNCLDK